MTTTADLKTCPQYIVIYEVYYGDPPRDRSFSFEPPAIGAFLKCKIKGKWQLFECITEQHIVNNPNFELKEDEHGRVHAYGYLYDGKHHVLSAGDVYLLAKLSIQGFRFLESWRYQ